MDSYFNHDKIIIGSVEELEPNFFRASVTVPDPQVQLFLTQVQQAKETDSPPQEQDIRDAAKLLVYVAWEEVAHRQNRLNVGPPKFDPDRSEGVVQKGKDFKIVISGPLYPKPDMDAIAKIQVPPDSHVFREEMIEQELADQMLDLGQASSVAGPARRGCTLAGRLTVTLHVEEVEDDPVIFDKEGSLRLPTLGDDCAFEGLVLTDAVPNLLGATLGEIVWEGQAPTDANSSLVTAKARYGLKIRNVDHRDPASVKDVVDHYGMKSEAELRQVIESGIKARLNSKNAQFREGVLLQNLLSFAPDIPPSILEQVEKEATEKFVNELQSAGLSESEVKEKLEGPELESALDAARLHLKQTVMIHMLQDEFEISMTEEDLMQAIREQSAELGIRPEELRNKIIEERQLDAYQSGLKVRKVLRALLKQIDGS